MIKNQVLINYFRYITFQKLYNLLLLVISYFLSNLFKRNIHWGTYAALSVEPINTCNLSCPECPTGMDTLNRKKGTLSFENFKKILHDSVKNLMYLNFYFQGEPFLNKDLLKMIKWAHSKKIYTSTSTNAQTIDRDKAKEIVLSGLDRLLISIDGTTQEAYEKYRVGGDLSKLIAATKDIVYWKRKLKSKTPLLVFQFIVFRFNEHQILDIKQLTKRLGVDKLELKTAQLYHLKDAEKIVPRQQKYARYKKDKKGKWQLKNSLANRCWRMWHSAVVTQDLNVLPCCFDKDANHILGNIAESTLQDISQSASYKNFRAQIIKDRASVTMCRNCSEGLSL